jgi:integrase
VSPSDGRLDPKTKRQLPDGIRYRADRNKYQVRVWAVGIGGEMRERSFLVGSLAEAKRLRAEVQSSVRPDGAMTLDAWHARYWSTIDVGVRPATARAYDVAWRKRVKPWLGHRKIETITVGDIEQAINGWDGSASTRNDALSMLSRLLDGAARAHVIAGNPARLVRRPRDERAQSVRSRALSVSEVRIMLDAVEAGPYRAYLAALVYTGMRAGEASALRVEDIDVPGRVIHVRRNFSMGRSGTMIEQSPKSHKERTVPLPQALLLYVDDAINGKRRSDLAFSGPRGGVLNPSNVRRAVDWDALRRKLDRPELRIHDLRHTLATLLFDAGAAANDVQAILGHSSLQVTERYSRARADVALRANAALDSLSWTEES